MHVAVHLAVLVLAGLVAPALSAEPLGRVEARLAGEDRVWQTLAMARPGGSRATATLALGADRSALIVDGHPGPGFATAGTISIEASFEDPPVPGRAPPRSVEILYMPEGMAGPFWTSKGAPERPVFETLSLDIWGAVGRVEALFYGQLCLRARLTSGTDPATCKEVSGRIATDLFVD